ncbi:RcnB family protein [Sphingomonas sp. PL-96]|uniref:RcnB family protein n=1 Tax=Sphingomonas sp. PL-96 TaxID=2887201 RepID=UPI001E457347|nr:RcnB family protein [Sphingomonas sp. PL-96]MCC2977533.1 RcnB family protein [Sphingomonas sp. PL-96]
MRTLILAALAAATTLSGVANPAAASAQSRYDPRFERPGDRHVERRGEWRRDDRRYARDHRWGRNDWRDYRTQNRRLYARGGWQAPFRYSTFRAGGRIAPSYYGTRYVIADPWRYRLPPVRPGQRWVRHYDDVLLVDQRRGRVVDVIRGFYW